MITPSARRALTALPLGAALLLATACGGGSDDTAAGSPASSSASSASSSSAPASSSGPSDGELKDTFCREAPGVLRQVSTELGSVQQTPTEAPQRLAEAVQQLQQLQPPASVAPQWQRFVDAVTGTRDLVGKLDLTNPQNNTQYAGELQALQPGLVDGGSAIDDWGKANC